MCFAGILLHSGNHARYSARTEGPRFGLPVCSKIQRAAQLFSWADGVITVRPDGVSCGPRERCTQMQPRLQTAFEEQVRKLGLTEETCATSEDLRRWCERNKDRCYIPEWLLKRWQISVDPNVSG